jgi:hypothetical protein
VHRFVLVNELQLDVVLNTIGFIKKFQALRHASMMS